MAIEDTVTSSAQLSFKWSTKKLVPKLVQGSNIREKNESSVDNGEKDYITAAENQELRSANPVQKKQSLVIPLITKNKWRMPDGSSGASELDKEAVTEMLKELRDGIESESSTSASLTIPMLMKNRLPPRHDGKEADEIYDVSLRPEQSSMEDYEDIPISAFGSAMLRGMGWSEGQPIGLTNQGLSEPVEYIPRHKGLGLGAEKRPDDIKLKRKRRLGEDPNAADKKFKPIVDKDGRVRHVKGISQEVNDKPQGFFIGAYVQIEKGIHKSLYGKIVAVDEDNARISAKLALSGEVIQISQYNTSLVDKEDYLENSARVSQPPDGLSKPTKAVERRSPDAKDLRKVEASPKHLASEPCWLVPNIRVRVISKTYKRGVHYNKKVRVIDVIAQDMCTCQADDKKMLEDVRQAFLETIVPKNKGSYVMVVLGKYKGKIGKLLDRDRKSCRATIQLTSNKHVTSLPYDCISEYLGEIPDDDFE